MKEVLKCLSGNQKNDVVVIAQPEHRLRGIPRLVVKEVRIPSALSRIAAVAAFYKALLAASALIVGAVVLLGEQVDVIYARHGINSFGAIILSKLSRKPLVLEVNGLFFDEATYHTLGKMQLTKRLAWLLDMFGSKCSDRIVAVTDGIKKAIQEIFAIPPSRIEIAPNGANTNLFRPIDQNAARQAIGLEKDDRIVCFVGSIHYVTPWPGMNDLIASAPRVLDKIPNARFLIIGNGPLKDHWHSLVRRSNLQEAFIFAGKVPYDLVPTYINASDICVVPFRRAVNEKRGLSPLKLYECLACGKPIVGSDITGIGDLLRSSDAGIAVPPEDPEGLANAIAFLLENKQERARMAKNARQIAVASFSWENTARRISLACARVSAKEAMP